MFLPITRLFSQSNFTARILPSTICRQIPPNRSSSRHTVTMPSSTVTTSLATQSLQDFCTILASKQPTPGGGASAAVGAAIGAGAAAMSASYTQRKKDEESGAADAARALINDMDIPSLLAMADDDVNAYQALQSTWKKDHGLSVEQVDEINAQALKVPTVLVEACYHRVKAINGFLPHCNPNIKSDAKVGIHQLAGSARAAYQTVLVNTPPADEKARLLSMLREMQNIENELLGIE